MKMIINLILLFNFIAYIVYAKFEIMCVLCYGSAAFLAASQLCSCSYVCIVLIMLIWGIMLAILL